MSYNVNACAYCGALPGDVHRSICPNIGFVASPVQGAASASGETCTQDGGKCGIGGYCKECHLAHVARQESGAVAEGVDMAALDTPEFRKQLDNWWHSHLAGALRCPEYAELIAYIAAIVAQQREAGRRERDEEIESFKRRCDLALSDMRQQRDAALARQQVSEGLTDEQIKGAIYRGGIRYSTLRSCDEQAAIALVRECLALSAVPPAKAEGMSDELRLKAARWDALRCNWECNYDRKGKYFQFFYDNRGELSGSAKSYNDIPDLESVVDGLIAQQAKGAQP